MKSFLQKMNKSEFLLWIGIAVIYLALYGAINHLPIHRETIPFILGEDRIPFLPWTFVIYISIFVQYFVVIRRMPRHWAKTLAITFGTMVIVALSLFVIFPIQFPRELYTSNSGLIALFRMIDGPGNCFPSLHVAGTIFFTSCYASVEKLKWKKVLMWVWTLLIVVSVLTTKQHYLIDIFGALLLVIPFIAIFHLARNHLIQ